MSHRFLAVWSAGFVLVVGGLLLPALATGQARAAGAEAKAAAKAWTPPMTPYGQPDLRGVWENKSATPLERPSELAGKPFLTDQEVAELKKRAARIFDPNGNADFAGGDGFFLALLANPERYTNPNVTGSVTAMVERSFDNRTSLIVDPSDGKIPPLTAEGRTRVAATPAPNAAPRHPAAGPEDLPNALRCITYGMPRLGVTNLNAAGPLGYYQIVQAPGYVALFLEAIHETRIIPVNGSAHLPASVRQWSGDSRGHWEGNTLVVDTTNFSPKSYFLGATDN